MPGIVKTYDPGQVLINFRGQPILGFADGSFVRVERNEDAFLTKAGADGEIVRARNRNRSGRVTITLMQSSPSNDVLSQAAIADEKLAGTGMGPLQVKDNLGTTQVNAPNAWVVKQPAIEFAKEVGTREWVLECDQLVIHTGGLL